LDLIGRIQAKTKVKIHTVSKIVQGGQMLIPTSTCFMDPGNPPSDPLDWTPPVETIRTCAATLADQEACLQAIDGSDSAFTAVGGTITKRVCARPALQFKVAP
jgi:hypothetical protein